MTDKLEKAKPLIEKLIKLADDLEALDFPHIFIYPDGDSSMSIIEYSHPAFQQAAIIHLATKAKGVHTIQLRGCGEPDCEACGSRGRSEPQKKCLKKSDFKILKGRRDD